MSDDTEDPSVIRYAVAFVSGVISAVLLHVFFRGSKSYHTGWQHASLTIGVIVLAACLLASVIVVVRYSDCYARWNKPLPPKEPEGTTSAADELRPRFPDPTRTE